MSTTTPASPGSRLDYLFDWSAWLPAGDSISSHTVTVTGGTLDGSSAASGIVTAWVIAPADAPDGAIVTITCAITTAQNRQDTRRQQLQILRR